MPIPADELALVQGIQTDLANAKASLAAAKVKAGQLMTKAQSVSDGAGFNHAYAAKTLFDEALAGVGRAHSQVSDRFVLKYGAADAGPVVMGGGAR